MSERLCEVCGKHPATFVCIQCRRLICKECTSPIGWLCKECFEYKRNIEKNRELQLKYIARMLNVCANMFTKKECMNCAILREFLLSLLKMVRGLQEEAARENFERVLKMSAEIEKKLISLLVIILAKQGISLPGGSS